MSKVKKVCANCGSENFELIASVYWDVTEQKYTVNKIASKTICNNCNSHADIKTVKTGNYNASVSPTEKALNFLSANGFQSAVTWHIDDVKNVFECTDEQAMEILENTFENENVVNAISYAINFYANELNLKEK